MHQVAYIDFAATTPVDRDVAAIVMHYMQEEFGNAGSRTHEYGSAATHAVQSARSQIATVADVEPEEVVFTSGATESNNLALLGLSKYICDSGKKHALCLSIEHKAVLEPLQYLSTSIGLDLELIPIDESGRVAPSEILQRLRPDTVVVSTMHANNETGIIQPLDEIADVLADHPAYWHVDAAQSFAKIGGLENPRIDLISVSGHKLFAPMGVGALIARKRGYVRPPITSLMFGGGQERGLRPGTLAVPLIAGLGLATNNAMVNQQERHHACREEQQRILESLEQLDVQYNGDLRYLLPHILNLSIRGIDAEAAMIILKDSVAISNGAACTSSSYQESHVLKNMGMSEGRSHGALRLSWSHHPTNVEWDEIVAALQKYQ